MQNWKKLPTLAIIWAVLGGGAMPAFGQGASKDAVELPEAPKPKVIDRRFVAVYGVLAASKAADMWTTSSAISRGCHEANPIFAGPRPSDRRLALTAAGYFAGEVALGYAVKRFGRGHRWTRALWLIEPARQTEEHITFAWGNAQRSCRPQ